MKTRRFCPKCGRMLLRSRIKGYVFQCMNCDEDFYRFEVLTRKQKRMMDLNIIRKSKCSRISKRKVHFTKRNV